MIMDETLKLKIEVWLENCANRDIELFVELMKSGNSNARHYFQEVVRKEQKKRNISDPK